MAGGPIYTAACTPVAACMSVVHRLGMRWVYPGGCTRGGYTQYMTSPRLRLGSVMYGMASASAFGLGLDHT